MKITGEVTRSVIEDFLYREAFLLDQWNLDEWLKLLTDDCTYHIPSNDAPKSESSKALFLIADDYRRISERVNRLKDKNAHSEFPHSRTRRVIGNVQFYEPTDSVNSLLKRFIVDANFVIYRHRREGDIRTYVGRYEHEVRLIDSQLFLSKRKVLLDAYELGSMGLVSFIL
jgi:p-cumate 2,3-dioxygenase beta subunit